MAPTGSPDLVAQASGIVKSFGAATPALDGVDLIVKPGIVTGLVGPDGAGKTTLIRILAGLMKPDAGSVAVLGAAPAQRLDSIGYMPQRFGLYEDLTVHENLVLYAELRGLDRSAQQVCSSACLILPTLPGFRSARRASFPAA